MSLTCQRTLLGFNLLLISSCIQFSFDIHIPKYLNVASFSHDLLATCVQIFCPVVISRDTALDLSLLLKQHDYQHLTKLLFLSLWCLIFSRNKLTKPVQIISSCVPFNPNPFLFTRTSLIVYSKAKLKIKCDKRISFQTILNMKRIVYLRGSFSRFRLNAFELACLVSWVCLIQWKCGIVLASWLNHKLLLSL
jgi:hypothetical protein